MSTYAIGDIQGCYSELMSLLHKINFDPNCDSLWFVGDLVNRGPESLQVLRFVKQLKNCVSVLGNHDLHLLAVYHEKNSLKADHTLDDILQAPDAEELIKWMRLRPLMHYDADLGYALVHAGIYPLWTIAQAKRYAEEVEFSLQGEGHQNLLAVMYGNKPDIWNESLTGYDRLRFIFNCFTRMRFCSAAGQLELTAKNSKPASPPDYMPWFEVPNRPAKNDQIIFGHWAALCGKVTVPNVYALDTGCVWGRSLTAMRLEDKQLFSVPFGAAL